MRPSLRVRTSRTSPETFIRRPASCRPVVETAILRALTELDRWEERQADLRAELTRSRFGFRGTRPVAEVRAELAKVDRQVLHYQALTRDMKRSARPATMSDMLRALVKL